MSNTIISYNGEKAYYNNDNAQAPFLYTKATNNIYLNSNCYNFCYDTHLPNYNFMQQLNTSLISQAALMFDNCENFNEELRLPNATNCYRMLCNCYTFNKNIIIDNASQLFRMLSGANNYNCELFLPATATNVSNVLNACTRFNNNVVFGGNNIVDASEMMKGCEAFNREINIPDGVANCYQMFRNCYKLNVIINTPANLQNAQEMFSNCYNLKEPVNIRKSDNVVDCAYMFAHCQNLTSVVGGNSARTAMLNCMQMFYNSGLIYSVQLGEYVNTCYGVYMNCANLQQIYQFPKLNVCSFAFACANCVKLTSIPNIPVNARNCVQMFRNCHNLTRININISTLQTEHNFAKLIQDRSNAKRINIFCNNLSLLNMTDATNSITGTAITWASITNGYRNTLYNVYLYRNYTGNL